MTLIGLAGLIDTVFYPHHTNVRQSGAVKISPICLVSGNKYHLLNRNLRLMAW